MREEIVEGFIIGGVISTFVGVFSNIYCEMSHDLDPNSLGEQLYAYLVLYNLIVITLGAFLVAIAAGIAIYIYEKEMKKP